MHILHEVNTDRGFVEPTIHKYIRKGMHIFI